MGLATLLATTTAAEIVAKPAPDQAMAELEAQKRELRLERARIDQKLAEIDARLRGGGSTSTPSAEDTGPSHAADGEGKQDVPGEKTTPTAEPMQTTAQPAWYNAHGQATVITQKHDAFHAPYEGQFSLQRIEPIRTSVTATLFIGAHLPWAGGEVYLDPEVAGGEGFSGVAGIAGFPNGEIPRVGTPEPQPYVARLLYRQIFGLGGNTENFDDAANQLPGTVATSRFTVVLGKFSAVDYFQQSAYANDPRIQFENWGLFTDGAWDYPADTRGYTEGALLELNSNNWSVRYGAMAEPKRANGGTFDSRILDALGHSLEFERRWTISSRPGSAKLMAFLNRSHAGNYRQSIDHPGPNGPDVTLTRTFREKYGIGFTADQQLSDGLGVFTRLAWNDGHSESWAFTEIDRSVALGFSLKGIGWHRPDDMVGLAGTVNWLAKDHRDYLGAGGVGFIIGDGRLPNYAPEEIIEAFYNFKLSDQFFITPDFQLVNHPAYNSDRGPVFIGGIRAHAEF